MTEKYLTGSEARKHLELLSCFVVSPKSATEAQLEAARAKARGYFKHAESVWIAFDNAAGYCFVESFTSEETAKTWLDINGSIFIE